jgi:hypothetical protein
MRLSGVPGIQKTARDNVRLPRTLQAAAATPLARRHVPVLQASKAVYRARSPYQVRNQVGRVLALKHAGVVVYLGPPAQTPVLLDVGQLGIRVTVTDSGMRIPPQIQVLHPTLRW